MVANEYKQCPFKILGLQRGATVDEINRAYRKAILKVHPDKCGGPHAEERAKVINNARDRAIAAADGRRRGAYASDTCEEDTCDEDDEEEEDIHGNGKHKKGARKRKPAKQAKPQQKRGKYQPHEASPEEHRESAEDAAAKAAKAAEEMLRRREQERKEAEERRQREQREAQERRLAERMRIIEDWRKEWGALFTEENAARWSINCNGRPLQRHEALDARERLRRGGAGKAC